MALSYTPEYPIPGEQVTLTADSLIGTTDATQFEIASVPDGSEIPLGLIVDSGGDPSNLFTPDVDGVYGITIYDYRRRSGITDDDPSDLLVATQSGSVYVAVEALLPMLTEDNHGATLQLRLISDSVRAASIVDPLDELSRVSSIGTLVTVAVKALVDQNLDDIASDFDVDVIAIGTAYGLHIVDETVHAAADTVNSVDAYQPDSKKSALEVMKLIADAVYGHLRGITDGTGAWHRTADDTRNYPIAKRGDSFAAMQVVRADIRERVYERHRVMTTLLSGTIHDSADTTHALSAPSLLDNVIVAFFDEIATLSPVAPAGEQTGAVKIERSHGFTIRLRGT